jgi:hypothetical protein
MGSNVEYSLQLERWQHWQQHWQQQQQHRIRVETGCRQQQQHR